MFIIKDNRYIRSNKLDHRLTIEFASGATTDIVLDNNEIAEMFGRMIKNLKHVFLPYRLLDNPYNYNSDVVSRELTESAQDVNVTVDIDKINQQEYLNKLHTLYENSCNDITKWLRFHEAIHAAELVNNNTTEQRININYREQGGPVEKLYKPEHYNLAVTKVQAGDIIVGFSELGKEPFYYWLNQEPQNVERFCQLSKPWIKLRPKCYMYLADQDLLPDADTLAKFNQWFAQYKPQWLAHWGIDHWGDAQNFGVVRVGKLTDVDFVRQQMKLNDSINQLIYK
jgi:hypothetical protein